MNWKKKSRWTHLRPGRQLESEAGRGATALPTEARAAVAERLTAEEEMRAERGAREREKRLRTHQAILLGLMKHKSVHTGDAESAFRVITEAAAHGLSVERASIWLYTADRSELHCADLYQRSEERHSEGARLQVIAYPGSSNALDENRTIAAHDAHADPRTKEFSDTDLTPLEITSTLDAPVRLGGTVAGVLRHELVGPPREWTADEESLAASLADLVSLVLEAGERRRAEEALHRTIKEFRAQEEESRRKSEELMETRLVLEAERQRYIELFEMAPDGCLVTDLTGVIREANRAAAVLMGLPKPSLIGKPLALFVADSERQAFRSLLNAFKTSESPDLSEQELAVTSGDGRTFPVSLTGSHARDPQGRIAGLRWLLRDVTEKKRAEVALRRREKLASMGSLLAGVAHELNNPLSVIMGRATLLQQMAENGRIAAQTEKIAQAAERCTRIVRNFLALARERPAERKAVQVNQVVHEALELLAYPLRVDNVDVILDLDPELPPIWADPDQLHQVVMNLITNAHHAMLGSSQPHRLTVSTRFDRTARRLALAVADSGPGIPPEIQEKIFEPFFTTKPQGEGTGLGLSLCQGMIEQHGGSIRVESRPGHGATFTIRLPVTKPAEVGTEHRAQPSPRVHGKKILVVEDESELANLLKDLLSVDGHRVETAGNGATALAKLEGKSYDLIFSDVRMPVLDGPGFYRKVEERHPGLHRRLIFITGDALNPQTKEWLRTIGVPNLAKPFVVEEIRRVIQETLET